MPVIQNRSDTLVLLRLNSGATHHLAPGEAVEVEPVEVKGNTAIGRLAERRLIAVQDEDAAAPGEGGNGGEPAAAGGDGYEAEAAPRTRGRKR